MIYFTFKLFMGKIACWEKLVEFGGIILYWDWSNGKEEFMMRVCFLNIDYSTNSYYKKKIDF